MGVYLTDFSFAIAKIELLDFLVDFLLAMHLQKYNQFCNIVGDTDLLNLTGSSVSSSLSRPPWTNEESPE